MKRYCPNCDSPMMLTDFRFSDGYREYTCTRCGMRVSNGFKTPPKRKTRKNEEIREYPS